MGAFLNRNPLAREGRFERLVMRAVCSGRDRSPIGAIAWDVTQRHVHEALLLSDDAILAAQRWLWRELKLAVEPAAALGLAALHTGAYRPRADETVCLIVCGANLDPASLTDA